MAFYVPVSEFPINKQYTNNNMQTTKQLGRPSATGSIGGPTTSHISIPPQYVHLKVTAASGGEAFSGSGGEPYLPPLAPVGHYHSSAGEHYHTLAYGGQPQLPQQSQFHILPTPKQIDNNNGGSGVGGVVGGNNKYSGHSHHLLSSGLPGPSASATSSAVAVGKGNGNNAFVAYKEINPIRHKTVQHFPPLSAASSTSSSSSSSSVSKYETIRQQQQQQHYLQQQQQQKQIQYGTSGGGVFRPRTKQSKINLTPFTPSNTVPGDFVPIVYTPLSNINNNINYNSNNNNNVIASHAASAGATNDDTVLKENEKQYYKQQQQQQQQIGVEYSPASIDAQQPLSILSPHHHNLNYHQQIQQHQHQHNPKQQSQYFSATGTPVSAANTDLTHEDGVVNAPLRHHHQHHHQNTQTISPHLTIYHQQHQHQQPEHVIIDAALRPSQQPQPLTLIGSKQQQQQQHQQQQYRSKPIQYQSTKPESSFESEQQQHLQQHEYQEQLQHQHHNIEQVLKDVNSYDTKSSHTTTPQEKYVMYLQHQMRYNKHQQQQQQQQPQQQHTTRQKYREHNNKEHEQLQYAVKQQHQQQQQLHNTQFFVLSSTASPHDTVAVTALSPIGPSQKPHFSPNYSHQSPAHHPLYSRPDLGSKQPHSDDEQIVTIPVHSLFGELDTLQNNHYSQSHASHHAQYPKKAGPSTPQYIDYLIDEPKQSLDDEHNPPHRHQHQHTQLETLKPTLGPPSHAFILVSTAAPFVHDVHAQENYGSTLMPPYKNKPKIRLQPVLKEEKNVIYPIIRQQNPTERPQTIVAITPPANTINDNGDSSLKYVYANQEFGQKLTAVKLKPSNKYESDSQRNYQQQQQQQQHNVPLQPLAARPPTAPVSDEAHYKHHSHNQQQTSEVEVATQQQQPLSPITILEDPNELPDIRTSSLAEILHKLQKSNHLPHTLTPDNIDNSIKTLIRILNNLKETQKIVANPPQHHEAPTPNASSPDDYDYPTASEEEQQQPKKPHAEHPSSNDLSLLSPPPSGPNKHPGPSTGRPGIDYPNYAEIPQTSFDCTEQRYKGFFGDPETNCQVWHYCDLNGGKASFLCPNGTIFSQIALTCDWWFNVKCGTTTQLYVLNERLYKYILPFTPKFPEDYSGPLVDKYLAMKFQEMEEKMRIEKEKVRQQEAEAATEQDENQDKSTPKDSKEDNQLEETTTEDNNRKFKSSAMPPTHKLESVNSQVSEQSSERNLLIDDEVNDISQRGASDTFDSTTISTITATAKPEPVSFSLKPIIVSSTIGPDYDEEQHDDKRRQEQDNDIEQNHKTDGIKQQETVKTSSGNHMHITVEKVNVIEIKPDGATGHLIRDMLLKSKKN